MLKTEIVKINGVDYPVNIIIERRRNSRASIGKNCAYIRIPYYFSREDLSKEIIAMKSWIAKKLGQMPELLCADSNREYNDSDKIKVMDEEYTIKLNYSDRKSSSGKIIGDYIHLDIPSWLDSDIKKEHIPALISRIVSKNKLQFIENKVYGLNEKHFNKKINKILLKNHKSKWGSCSSVGNINISSRLLLAPEDVLDYVCIHELAHLTEKNHSKNFWKLVESAMPDYKEKKKWLKDNGSKCVF